MTDIEVISFHEELRTDSRSLASLLDHRHRNIFANITKYTHELKQLGIVRFEKARLKTEHLGDREQHYAMLNEDQCYFLLTLARNNESVVAAKLKLVKAFRDARTQLAKRDIARIDGKEVRRMETDAIADLIDYAKAKGSKSADNYYLNVTRMTNGLLGIEPDKRNILPTRLLEDIAVMERIVSIAISDGLNAGLHYKDIFQLAKRRCTLALPSIGRDVAQPKKLR